MILDMLLKRVMGNPDLLLKLILRLLRLAVMHTDNKLDDRIIEMFQDMEAGDRVERLIGKICRLKRARFYALILERFVVEVDTPGVKACPTQTLKQTAVA